MNNFPANEQTISEVERGRSCRAIVSMPPGQSVSAGDSVLFALALGRTGNEPCYVKGGDSVRVLLTDVTELGTSDPSTGLSLYQLTWAPLGQAGSPAPPRTRASLSDDPQISVLVRSTPQAVFNDTEVLPHSAETRLHSRPMPRLPRGSLIRWPASIPSARQEQADPPRPKTKPEIVPVEELPIALA